MRSENALFNKEESRLEVGVGRDAVVGCGDRSLGVEPFKGSLQTAWHLSDLSKLWDGINAVPFWMVVLSHAPKMQ
jgi:hypothetical protein